MIHLYPSARFSLSLQTAVAVLALVAVCLPARAQAPATPPYTPNGPALQMPEGLRGDFQWDFATYRKDDAIGAPEVPERIGSNAYLQLLYDKGPFSAGVRFESYQPPLLGFDPNYRGTGLPYRFIRYNSGMLDITVGNIYDQFGSGTAFRTYQEWGLGYDNSLDGVRAIVRPGYGLQVKGLIGTQRKFFTQSPGIVRGADVQWRLAEVPGLDSSAWAPVTLGLAGVSRYQRDDNPTYILPQNSGLISPRLRYDGKHWTATFEYAYRGQDPSAANAFIYRPGQALWAQIGYGKGQLGFTLAAKRIDNMDFRSDRNEGFNNVLVNYLPPLTPQLTYRLTTLYPYATQPVGEMGLQADFFYRVPAGRWLGSTSANFIGNYTRIQGLDRQTTGDLRGYTSPFFKPGGEVYYELIQAEAQLKFNPRLKGTLGYYGITANIPVIKVAEYSGIVYSHTGVADLTYKLPNKRSLRLEGSYLHTRQDRGSWALLLAEYTIAPHFFFSVWDEYNLGNAEPSRRIHYIGGQAGYIAGSLRVTAGYGRQRAGVFCVGGVCRVIPASNGMQVSVSGNF